MIRCGLTRTWGTLAIIGAGLLSSAAGSAPPKQVQAPEQERQVDVQGGAPVTIYVPQGLKARPAPLVLLLHGSYGEGQSTLIGSGLRKTADRHRFIIAAPNGAIKLAKGYAWNIPGVPAATGRMPTSQDRDDVRYLLDVVDTLVQQGLADPTRIYATGISGGGRMASWLACAVPERIAAVAPVVGLRAGTPLAEDPTRPDSASCQPRTAMPILAFAGDSDTTNPIQGGGSRYWQYSMRAAEERWAQLNGCATTTPAVRWISPKIYENRYGGCRDKADVVARITVGGTHNWLADNEALWAFFKGHKRVRPASGQPIK